MREKKIAPIPPGEILLEEFLKPMNISQYKLAKDIYVPPIDAISLWISHPDLRIC